MPFSILWKWLPTPSPSPDDGDQIGDNLQTSHQRKAESTQSKLLVTFFANSTLQNSTKIIPTAEKAQSLHSLPATCKPAFTKLLTSLLWPAALSLCSSQSLSPHVLQLTYLISSTTLNPANLRRQSAISNFEKTHSLEMVLDLPPDPVPSHRPIKLAIFDMDSTLIEEEVIDELAGSIGVTSAVSAITARAMNGDIDFEQSLRERLALLEGVNTDVWEKLRKHITIAAGARELCKELRRRGVITAVASGGFAPMADWLKDQLGLDYAFANHLLTSAPTATHPHEHLTGLLSPSHPVVTPTFKRDTLISLADTHAIPLSETLAVGDGSNDLLMLGAAGLGIAWKAKPRVQREAPQRLNGKSLVELLFLLGPEPGVQTLGIEKE